jgi:hypothetical protein
VVGRGVLTGVIIGALVDAAAGAEVSMDPVPRRRPDDRRASRLAVRPLRAAALDRPRQQVVLQPLAQPYVHPDGVGQTHQQVAPVHPQTGEPVWVRPRSSLFFIPVRYWPFVVAGIGIVLTISSAVRLLVG